MNAHHHWPTTMEMQNKLRTLYHSPLSLAGPSLALITLQITFQMSNFPICFQTVLPTNNIISSDTKNDDENGHKNNLHPRVL